MARRTAQFWSEIVTEAESAGVPHAVAAAKHRVSLPALKYHIYKARSAAQSSRNATSLLPVRVTGERRTFDVELGALRLIFSEGCEPAYVAAVLSALRKC
jgi:hypothetical protein